jgi:hypothetical protein
LNPKGVKAITQEVVLGTDISPKCSGVNLQSPRKARISSK